jgi:hypothetical protein
MLNKTKIFLLLALTLPLSAFAKVVTVEQQTQAGAAYLNDAPYYLSTSAAKVYVEAGLGKTIDVSIKDLDGQIIQETSTLPVEPTNTFIHDGVQYTGMMVSLF